MTEELKPCPFCKHQPKGRINQRGFYQVNCDNVNCKNDDFEAEHRFSLIAINRWNAYAKRGAK